MRQRIHYILFFIAALMIATSAAAQGKKKAAAASEQAPSYNIGILPFQDISGGDYGRQLKDVLSKKLQAALLSGSSLTPRLMKLGGDNPDQTDVDIAYAVKLGKFYKSDLVVMGSLLQADVEESQGGFNGPSIGGVSISSRSRSQDASVVLQADIIDVSRGVKLTSVRATGKDHESKISPNINTSYGSMDMGGSDFQKTALGKATQNAVQDLVSRLISAAQSFTPGTATEAASSSSASASSASTPAGNTASSASASAGSGSAGGSCHVLFRVLLTSSMSPLKDYAAAVGGQDLSAKIKDGVLQIDNPAAQLAMQVTIKNPPADAKLHAAYPGSVDCNCDKPEKILVLEIDSDGNGKFNWWQ